MKKLNYRNQLIILFTWILVVGILFSTITNKPLAGVIAGIGFNLIPLAFLGAEFKKTSRYGFHIVTLLLFLTVSALPIFLLRVCNWGVEFKELSLLGFSSDTLHRGSNGMYFLMIVSTTVCFYKNRKKPI